MGGAAPRRVAGMSDAASPIHAAAFKEALVVLGATAAVIPVFHRLRVSPVIGFILIGMILGPSGLGALTQYASWLKVVTISDREALAPIAEWGVVLLLFTIGLELSLERLKIMSRLVFGLGALQIALCTAGLAGALLALGVKPAPAVIIGVALAQSSTAVLIQVLAENKKLRTPAGRASFAVLLCQDLSVAPILFGVAVLSASTNKPMLAEFGVALLAAAVGVAALVVIGRFTLRPLFRSVARTQTPELFLAACLLVIIGTALGATAAGLSAAMGALIAGMLLAETEYRRQVEVLIEPFKGLFLGVFLIAAGMSIDLAQAIDQPALIVGGAVALIAIKAAIIFVLARLFKLNTRTALPTALLLAPGGEFAFVILGAAAGAIDPDARATALTIAAITMIALPLLSQLSDRLVRVAARGKAVDAGMLLPDGAQLTKPAVIAGFGRVGRVVADLLEEFKIPYIALDTDPDVVSAARRKGRPVYFGDASNPAMLERIGLATMRALIATMDSPERVEAIVASARAARSDLMIVARARDAAHAAKLYKLGASDVAPETIEASLQLSEAVLVDLGIPMGPVIAAIHDRRALFRAEVQKLAPDAQIASHPRPRLRERLFRATREEGAASTRED
jgi:CPA2 family monovalent cation:H+ antiporter-2